MNTSMKSCLACFVLKDSHILTRGPVKLTVVDRTSIKLWDVVTGIEQQQN